VTAVYDALDELLRAQRPDAVIVATPPRYLTAHASRALHAGAQVLLEKPGAATPVDVERLAQASMDHGPGRCIVGYPRRYRTGWDRVRALLSAGRVGDVRHVRLAWRGPYRARFSPDADSYRATPAVRVGGVVLDTGSHMVDLCHFLLGTTIEVAFADLVLAEDGADIGASWNARLAGGATVEASIADSGDAEHGEVTLEGTRGRMWIRESGDRVEIAVAGEEFDERGYVARPVDDLVALHRGQPTRGATIEQAVRAAAAVQSIYRAARMKLERAPRWISPRAKCWGRLSGAC
jgi:predicted dehydrogenase